MRALAMAVLLLVTGCTSSVSSPVSVRVPITRPDWAALDIDTVTPLGRSATSVSDDPLEQASLAVQELGRPPYVLGTDGRWRLVVAPSSPKPSGGRSDWGTRRESSLDAGGTRIAVPKNHALVVVDLTTGRSRSYEVPGRHWYAAWVDESHVLVVGRRRLNVLVDVRSGLTEPSSFGWGTQFLPDGSAVTWGRGHGNDLYRDGALHWDDGRDVTSPANNAAASAPPLARDGVAVSLHRASAAMGANPVSTGDQEIDDLLTEHNGVAAVDSSTGDLLGFLELGTESFELSSVVGWDGDLPVVALADVDAWPSMLGRAPAYLARWDYRAGTLEPLATLPRGYVSWGVGL